MNFYASQDRARNSTRWLVLLTLLALVLITFVSSWVLLISLRILGLQSLPYHTSFYSLSSHDWPLFAGVATFIIGGAVISAYLKARELSKGGQAIATSLGGQKIQTNTPDANQRKAINVVEEMAIASGMPTPDVYVLQKEEAINAFAAGLTPTDAVIGLTQGAIEKLSRSQLQGVVGHEFSHILNGDMRLNSRLIMLVTGIEFIGLVGRVLSGGRSHSSRAFSRRSSRGKGSGAIVLVGVALRLIGWLGGLFGRMIQAAVSRQREYLADASAVQFTRNPVAVAEALKVIGGEQDGSHLRQTNSGQFSHLFFGQVFTSHLNFLFATHPPLDRRIQLLQPSWDGQYLAPLTPILAKESEKKSEQESQQITEQIAQTGAMDSAQQEALQILGAAVTAASVGGLATQVSVKRHNNKTDYAALLERAQEPNEAVSLLLAVLLHLNMQDSTGLLKTDWLTDKTQATLALLSAKQGFPGIEVSLMTWFQQLQSVNLVERLSLVERSLSALKSLSEQQYQTLKKSMQQIVQWDEKTDIYEQTVVRLVTRFLDVHFGLAKPYKILYKQIDQVEIQVRIVLSMLAFYGHDATLSGANKNLETAFQLGLKACGLPSKPFIVMSAYSDNDFNHATEKLAHCSLAVKDQIMLGLQACIEHDGQIIDVERELILAIAATMDAPIPRFKL